MAKTAKDGTDQYCPKCKRITTCKALPPSALGSKQGQRLGMRHHSDIQWFRRVRKCNTCNHTFYTAEIQEAFLDELRELRSKLNTIKARIQSYQKIAITTSNAVEELRSSLDSIESIDLFESVR